MQQTSSSSVGPDPHKVFAQSVIDKTNNVREFLRSYWQWPSPQGGFAAFVLPSFGFVLENSLPSENQLRRGEAPLLAAIGYGFACSEAVRVNVALAGAWSDGMNRLSRKETFPVDGESFVFRPLELLGIGLGVQHCPNLPAAIVSWFKNTLNEAQTQRIFNAPWATLLAHISMRQFGATTPTVPLQDDYDVATLSLWLWIQKQMMGTPNEQGDFIELHSRLVRQYVEIASLPNDYAVQAVLFSQIAPIMQQSIQQLATPSATDTNSQIPLSPQTPGVLHRISHEQENLRNQIDFGIITVREDENRAVSKRFPVHFIYEGEERTYGINVTRLSDGTLYTTAIIRCIDQGTNQGQDVTRDLIADLNPHWIMLVGISGGVPESEWTLGDVLLASRLQDFSVHALIDGSRTEFASSGGPMHRSIQNFLAYLPMVENNLGPWNTVESIGMQHPNVSLEKELFYGDEAWKGKIKKSLSRHFSDQEILRTPIYKIGATASSDALVKDSAVVQQWLHNSRQLLNIEMELASVYTASRRTGREYPILAIRGISDIVGYSRHPDWTAYACQSAAAFARAVLEVHPFTPVAKTSPQLK